MERYNPTYFNNEEEGFEKLSEIVNESKEQKKFRANRQGWETINKQHPIPERLQEYVDYLMKHIDVGFEAEKKIKKYMQEWRELRVYDPLMKDAYEQERMLRITRGDSFVIGSVAVLQKNKNEWEAQDPIIHDHDYTEKRGFYVCGKCKKPLEAVYLSKYSYDYFGKPIPYYVHLLCDCQMEYGLEILKQNWLTANEAKRILREKNKVKKLAEMQGKKNINGGV